MKVTVQITRRSKVAPCIVFARTLRILAQYAITRPVKDMSASKHMSTFSKQSGSAQKVRMHWQHSLLQYLGGLGFVGP